MKYRKRGTERHRVHVYIDEEAYLHLELMSQRTELSKSELVTRLIKHYAKSSKMPYNDIREETQT